MMSLRLYVSYAADLIAVILMIWQLIRIKKLPVEEEATKKYFTIFSGVVLIMSVLHLLKSYSDLQLGVVTTQDIQTIAQAIHSPWMWAEIAATMVDIFMSTVFLCFWLIYLSWCLYEDRDFIRRKFWIGFTPILISVVVTCFTVPMAVMSEMGFWFFVAAICIFFIIRIFYFLLGLWLLREYKKQNGYLRFFNPYVFFVPVFAGWLLQDLFSWGFSALGSTLGVTFLYLSVVGEEKYMDRETRFYKMNFVDYLKKLVEKGKYGPSSAMTFTLKSDREMSGFSEILKKQLPNDCEPILKNGHELVVLTNVKERGPLAMVIEDVKAESDVNASCTLKKKKESALEFMERVL